MQDLKTYAVNDNGHYKSGIEQARQLILKEDFPAAQKLLKELKSKGQKTGEVDFYLGLVALGSNWLMRAQALKIAAKYFESSARAGYNLPFDGWQGYPISKDSYLDAYWQAVEKFLKGKNPREIEIAERLLQNVVAIDPESNHSSEKLGKLYLRTGRPRKAIEIYRKVLEANPDNNQSIYDLALDFLDIYEPNLANQILEGLSREDSSSLSSLEKLFLARALFALNKDSLACNYYWRCLDSLDDVTAGELLRDMTDIVLEKDRQDYGNAKSPDEKRSFFRNFWNSREPSTKTGYNGRLVEHYRRLNHSKRYYYCRMENGYDDRGKIYIKHGEPDQTATLIDTTSPNESWLYYKRPRDFIFHFSRNKYTRFVLLGSLAEIGGGSALYESRSDMDPFYLYASVKMRTDESGVMDELLYREFEILEPAFTLGKTTETYNPYKGIKPLDYYFYTADFMSVDSTTSLYVYYGLPVKKLHSEPESTGARVDYECTFSLFDREWNQVESAFDRRSYRLNPDPRDVGKGSLAVDRQIMNLRPGNYHYEVNVKDLGSNNMGVYRGNIEVSRYEWNKFSVSQPVLASKIEKVEKGRKPGKFTRGQLDILCLPSRTYSKDQKVFIYYEIYFLKKDADGKKKYRIDFDIEAEKLDRNLTTKVFSAFGSLVGKTVEKKKITLTFDKEQDDPGRLVQPDYFSIDISSSPPGKYNLKITVTDSASGEKATRQTSFTVVKAD
jgi:GWxTD domain-containing protein